jgi:hypothetical protein
MHIQRHHIQQHGRGILRRRTFESHELKPSKLQVPSAISRGFIPIHPEYETWYI